MFAEISWYVDNTTEGHFNAILHYSHQQPVEA
jgi:hypothetical protein